ncbi:MAG: alpha/beta hydrolase [Bacteroidota bacterium]
MEVGVHGHIINYELLNSSLLETNKTVLVFLHDGLGSIGQWKGIPQKLCDAVQLAGIVYDRHGYGLSINEGFDFKPGYFNEEAEIYLPEFLKKIGIQDNIILIGHSDGASIALIFASCFPEKVKAIISEAAHVFTEEITLEGIRALKEKYGTDQNLSNNLKKYHTDQTSRLFNSWVDGWLSDTFKNWNIEELLKNIKAPVLAIQGEEDEFTSIKQLEALKRNINTALTIHLLPDCRHFPHFEKETAVISLIQDFINQIITE